MAKLQNTRGKYPGYYEDWAEKDGEWLSETKPMPDGMMLPDGVLDALLEASSGMLQKPFEQSLVLDAAGGHVPPLNRHRLLIPEPPLTWEQSKELVIAAFTRFDEGLGKRVAQVLADPGSLSLRKVEMGEASAFCAPPDWQGRERAEIVFNYEGSVNDAVYLAHELGHLLAHDFAREAGLKGGEETWMPKHIAEVPAFFTQNILYDYLMNGQDDPALQRAGRQHFAGEITRALYEQQAAFGKRGMENDALQEDVYAQRLAEGLGPHWRSFEKARIRRRDVGDLHGHFTAATIATGLYHSAVRKDAEVLGQMFRRGSHSDILGLFGAAGITMQEELKGFFRRAIAYSVAPLQEIHAQYDEQLRQSAPKAFAKPCKIV